MKMEEQLKILVVDDDAIFNEALVFLAELKGIKAVQAYDAYQALQIIWTEGIDAVISDVNMPGMSGIELLREIKRLREDLPVIIMSGNTDPGLAEEAFQNGAAGFLPKPIDAELLMSMLRVAAAAEESKPRRESLERHI
jgi:two-component system sporulation sensor kinase A